MDFENIISSYENYEEEKRITTDNARKVEFLTTIKIMEEHLGENSKILDCAAGTGVYAFYMAEKGHDITAYDFTPRHIEIINNALKNKPYEMDTKVNDARDLSHLPNECFDAVFCMGPLYHLTDEEDRIRCLKECIRVLKKGGLLFSAYINRYYVLNSVVSNDFKYLDKNFLHRITQTGVLKSDDPFCFWTDAYFDKPELIEEVYGQLGLEIVDHGATDGMSIFLRDKVNMMNEEEYGVWCNFQYDICRERSILGISNHGLIVGKKE